MATTTIRIEDELKLRVAVAAEIAGKTTHAFILDAISETVAQMELDTQFQSLAEQRWSNIATTGKTVPWDATKEHLAARARGLRSRRPAARKPGV
ncbi:CopG family transcriptional regulator [Comamonadaceae bacterium G21597-S1]|nr:CopG family transcriptional regulator [Comamonadaceae bacterium G21597-S1]